VTAILNRRRRRFLAVAEYSQTIDRFCSSYCQQSAEIKIEIQIAMYVLCKALKDY